MTNKIMTLIDALTDKRRGIYPFVEFRRDRDEIAAITPIHEDIASAIGLVYAGASYIDPNRHLWVCDYCFHINPLPSHADSEFWVECERCGIRQPRTS